MLKTILTTIAVSLASAATIAHDFWLEPFDYTAKVGKKIEVEWRIGDQFAGDNLVYLPDTVAKMTLTQFGKTASLSSRFASKPAIKLKSLPEGTSLISLESIDFDVSYDSWESFVSFVEKEKVGYELPEIGKLPVEERYRRYAKTVLVSEGTELRDQRTGLKFEWVILDISETNVQLQLWYGNEPASDYVVKVFRKPLGKKNDSEPDYFRTDANGSFVLDAVSGEEVMLNSIKLSYDDAEAMPWYSEWASITFAVE